VSQRSSPSLMPAVLSTGIGIRSRSPALHPVGAGPGGVLGDGGLPCCGVSSRKASMLPKFHTLEDEST
jgi:hypothetical protein